MPNNRGTKNTILDGENIVEVLEITWQVTDPSGRWYAYIGETNEVALLGRLVSRGNHPQNKGFKVDSWTYEVISNETFLAMKKGGKVNTPAVAKDKKGPHYPGKNKIQVLLVGGPRDGEKAYFPKGLKSVELNVTTRPIEKFNIDTEIPFVVKVTYEKQADGNFHFVP